MHLFLVRHGQSQNNAGASVGHNVPLTPLGHQQLVLAANALQERQFDAFYCSPLERALQSASILSRGVGIAPYVYPYFAEVGFSWGEPDKSRAAVAAEYPEMHLDPSITDEGWAPADDETEGAAYERAGEVVGWLQARHPHPDSQILIVSHGRFGSILIGHLMGIRPCGYSRFGQSNGGISCIEMRDERVWLRFLNRTEHLPSELIT